MNRWNRACRVCKAIFTVIDCWHSILRTSLFAERLFGTTLHRGEIIERRRFGVNNKNPHSRRRKQLSVGGEP